MRIPCPYCGSRDVQEFTCLGSAAPQRPSPEAAENAMFDYVYMRDNPRGPHDEYWYHGAGCHAWLIVTRDTFTHAITGAVAAREAARGRTQ